jgi:hypothetical protein
VGTRKRNDDAVARALERLESTTPKERGAARAPLEKSGRINAGCAARARGVAHGCGWWRLAW